MSASDAAPLPRLGEVFFDVRGNSRSMRLSWYADTGVAVFSIWQGGMCTGTFRLAIADLPRMVETLQLGPDGQRPEWDDAPGQAFGSDSAEPRTGAADYLTGSPDYLTGSPDYLQGPPDYLAGPPDHRSRPPGDYLDPPPGRRSGAGEYPVNPPGDPLSGPPPGRRSGAGEYPVNPPGDPLSGPPPYRPAAGDYLAPAPDRPGGTADYPTGAGDYLGQPGDQGSAPADYLTGPPGYPARPPEHQTEYLADLPAPGSPDSAGYGDVFRPAGRSRTSYPGGESGAYPADSGHTPRYPGEPAAESYPGGTGPIEYQRESSVPQYQAGSAVPPQDDALGPGPDDYPAHYGTALTDDIVDERPEDSYRYGRRSDRR